MARTAGGSTLQAQDLEAEHISDSQPRHAVHRQRARPKSTHGAGYGTTVTGQRLARTRCAAS